MFQPPSLIGIYRAAPFRCGRMSIFFVNSRLAYAKRPLPNPALWQVSLFGHFGPQLLCACCGCRKGLEAWLARRFSRLLGKLWALPCLLKNIYVPAPEPYRYLSVRPFRCGRLSIFFVNSRLAYAKRPLPNPAPWQVSLFGHFGPQLLCTGCGVRDSRLRPSRAIRSLLSEVTENTIQKCYFFRGSFLCAGCGDR